MKTILGLTALFAIPLVYSSELTISGSIHKPGFTGVNAKLSIYQNGGLTTQVWYQPQKIDSSCTEDCTLEIVYDNNKAIRFNSKEMIYKHGGQIYSIEYTSDKYILDGCQGVQDCNYYILPFKFKVIEIAVT
ncbi:hypothetical protein BB559_002178 [Furculomyces boomerangus]|uniref:Uncharacterized protein n=1 Tax=Furculomyces boomerangus TaxID=61424 RepID=A0A2T9YXB2_9FUNG|nr:hypothetical protein BB559_002178 [Furculomyces boomerangus]